MRRCRGGVTALGFDQLATSQKFESGLDGALRQTRFFRERAEAGRDWFPSRAGGLAVKPNENEIRGRLTIMSHNVAHQNVEDVIVNWYGLAEPGHGKSKKEELERRKRQRLHYTDKRTQGEFDSKSPDWGQGNQRRLATARFFLGWVSPTSDLIA